MIHSLYIWPQQDDSQTCDIFSLCLVYNPKCWFIDIFLTSNRQDVRHVYDAWQSAQMFLKIVCFPSFSLNSNTLYYVLKCSAVTLQPETNYNQNIGLWF